MAFHVMQRQLSKDFVEGCRTLILDEDKNHKPSKLELISESMVDQYFSKANDDEWGELKLPARSNFPVYAISKI
ncbi:hypothetical protein TIFTF001_036045 [Ficus carica]|uniref:3-hydroxyisobutyryl-CoA hydrolase n=1 Tax=Ficus carica TaxID=3494 RepID=A0AA88E6X6_FICCA|nr:hypothetical protein TIFTF001_036045 [Ficus carica]